jgi:signal transduction histidine kinase
MIALQQVRTQIAGNLHAEINTTLNSINMLSGMAKIKADKDITRSKEYIDQIGEKSHNMIVAMDDMLWSIDPANDNMQKTILRIKEFVEALTSRHGVNIQMVVDNDVQSLKLDMESRHEFFLIFKEALRDMVQNTSGEDILINIDLIKSKLSLKIHDAGDNTGPSAILNGNTLKEIKKRAASIKAVLDVQTDVKGTSVILLIPV